MSGVVRDIVAAVLKNSVFGYMVVFILQVGMLVYSLFLLRKINVKKFKDKAQQLSLSEKAEYLSESV